MRAPVVLLALGLAACTPSDSEPETGSAPTIVSLNPCTDAILAEVAEPDRLLAISHYSHAPASSSMDAAKAQKYNAIGATVEEVLALQPDMVVASSFLAPATLAALTDLEVQVATFGIANTPQDSITQIAELAALAGNVEGGEALIGRINAALRRYTHNGQTLSAVLWQPAGIVPGEASLVSALMRHSGFASHSAAIGLGQADYLSLEQLLANPPDVLLIAGNERSQTHPALARLEGTHIARLDTSMLYCGGPTIIRALERLAEIREAAR